MSTPNKSFALKVAAAKIRCKGPNWKGYWQAFADHANAETIPLMSPSTRAIYEQWLATQ